MHLKRKSIQVICQIVQLSIIIDTEHISFLCRLNRSICARSQSFFLYSEPVYRLSKYYRAEMESRKVCYSSADMVMLSR
jgi:hypothetical protein